MDADDLEDMTESERISYFDMLEAQAEDEAIQDADNE